MINNVGNKMALHGFAMSLREKLHHAGDFHETTADEMAGDLRTILSNAGDELADLIGELVSKDGSR